MNEAFAMMSDNGSIKGPWHDEGTMKMILGMFPHTSRLWIKRTTTYEQVNKEPLSDTSTEGEGT